MTVAPISGNPRYSLEVPKPDFENHWCMLRNAARSVLIYT